MAALLRSLVLAFVFLSTAASAEMAFDAASPRGPDPALSSITPVQAADALQLLQNDARRAQLIGVLQTIARAAPAATASSATPATAAASEGLRAPTGASGSSTASRTASPAAPSSALPLVPNSLGVQLLNEGSQTVRELSQDLAATAHTVTSFPLLWRWLALTASDPGAREQVIDAAWKLLVTFGCAFLLEQMLVRLLRRPLRALRPVSRPEPADLLAEDGRGQDSGASTPADRPATEEPTASDTAPNLHVAVPATPAGPRAQLERTWHLVGRLPLVAAALLLELFPVAAFAIVGNLLLGTNLGRQLTSRLIVLTIVNAYAISRCLMSLTRMLFAPRSSAVRLVPTSDRTASYIERWVRRLAVGTVFGLALAEVALLLGLDDSAHETLLKLVALVIHVCGVVIILQCRPAVANWLRADPSRNSPVAAIRNQLAAIWHYLAIAVVMGLWVVWAVQIENGLSRLLHFLLATVAVMILARIVSIAALGSLDRLFQISPALGQRYPGLERRASRYHSPLRRLLSGAIFLLSVLALLQVWGVDALSWFRGGAVGLRLLSALTTIGVAVAVAVLVWEGVNAGMDHQLVRLTQEDKLVQAARLRTFGPMIRSALLILVLTVVGLTALSEIGVNIGPLLAGASIIGVALGFGSQKLVQDLINGIFLLLENAMQIGDWVTVSGLSGSVEDLSIRTIRLRAGDGSVHIIPFSSVTSVTNTNRGIGNAAVGVSVDFAEDTDRVCEFLAEIGAGLQQDPAFSALILSPLTLWGVDKVDGAQVTITGQIACTDGGRWAVQREFNRRVKLRFQELGIEIANSNTQTILMRRVTGASESRARSMEHLAASG